MQSQFSTLKNDSHGQFSTGSNFNVTLAYIRCILQYRDWRSLLSHL